MVAARDALGEEGFKEQIRKVEKSLRSKKKKIVIIWKAPQLLD
jgi:hypothetical protein